MISPFDTEWEVEEIRKECEDMSDAYNRQATARREAEQLRDANREVQYDTVLAMLAGIANGTKLIEVRKTYEPDTAALSIVGIKTERTTYRIVDAP